LKADFSVMQAGYPAPSARLARVTRWAILVCLLVLPAQGAAAADPRLLGSERLSPRLQELTLRTPDLAEPTKVRVLLPAGYASHPKRRYPVLYLLHGAAGSQASWTTAGDTEAQTAKLPLIVVMPDGGKGGFYSDWYNDGTGGLPRWETWHIDGLIPWIDGRYRTVADRSGRALAGLSMGGFGAFSYAARHPDMFTAALSMSGAVDPPLVPNVLGADGVLWGPFETEEVRWRARNPLDLAGNLRGLALWLRTGNGQPGGPYPSRATTDVIEYGTGLMTDRVHARLQRLSIPHVYDNYGPGHHIWPYWRRGLEQTLPGIMARFRRAPRPPARITYSSVDPRYSAYGWTVSVRRRALEFSTLANAGRRGFTLSGSGSATVTTPARYPPGRRLTVRVRGKSRTLRADRRGRLRVAVPLGPANAVQQYTAGARTRVFTTRVTIAR
jgi:S-formylglutathione hydrolase FrmB